MLLTNLLNKASFPTEEIIELYFRRWAIEDHYRTEKVVLQIEKFHGKTSNSIRQELFAVVIMSVIARSLMVLTDRVHGAGTAEYQFKNAIMTLAAEAAMLVPDDPEKAVEVFSEILRAISRVKYYRPKSPRPTQPRVTKAPRTSGASAGGRNLKKPNSTALRVDLRVGWCWNWVTNTLGYRLGHYT